MNYKCVLCCHDEKCNNDEHRPQLDLMYDLILESISEASYCLPHLNQSRKKIEIVGWNDYCKILYDEARRDFMLWLNDGRIRQGVIFENMKRSRKLFKNALNYCKQNEMKIRKENLLKKFLNGNKNCFWKDVSKLKGTSRNKVSLIDGKNEMKDIVSIFDNKYKRILDNPYCQTNSHSNAQNLGPPTFTPLIGNTDIISAISNLNTGVGWDGFHSNHFKFSGKVFKNLLSKFINRLISHSYVPKNMSHGEIRPVLKGNTLDKNDSTNYRPVMNSCMMLKILEYCLLPIMTSSLRLSNLQFGYRKNVGCLTAVSIVKETIYKYNLEKTNVHCAKVDLSKAFDCVNFKILFDKLCKTSLNRNITEILRFMYQNTYVDTKVNGVKSEEWKVGNGVRQGGILSPLLFGFYTNEVLESISNMTVGCSLNGYKVNIIAYADDVFLLSPTSEGLQLILNQLQSMINDLCLSINVGKCEYIIFKHKAVKVSDMNPIVKLNGRSLEQVKDCLYLGVVLNEYGNVGPDLDRIIDSFLKQFNGMYSKFYFADKNVLYFLFKSYTSSFYGLEVWHDKILKNQMNKISVAYHKAIKRISGFNTWDSNHEACKAVGAPIFKHLLAKRKLLFWHKIVRSKSSCMANLTYYFRYCSVTSQKLSHLFLESYNVDIVSNPLCAILARIQYVQRTEPRSYYVYCND